MIVLGADMHKSSHTLAAVAAATGEMLDEKTAAVGARGFDAVLGWARGLGDERAWALEDCRDVSGSLERFLIARGERVVRVPTRLMANTRRSSREHGKSDRIDANRGRAPRWARASRRCRRPSWPGRSSTLGCWSTTVSGWSAKGSGSTTRCSGSCTSSGPSSSCPAARCSMGGGGPRIARRLARAEQTMRVRIARDEVRRLRELAQAINQREREIVGLVADVAPQMVREPGFGALTAAKLLGEIAGADRFSSDAKLARAAGLGPILLSSGRTNRHRLDRGGNRQINAAIHRVAVTRAGCHPETLEYLARKNSEGKTHREAIRCLKRHLARRIWHLLRAPHPVPETAPHPSTS
jgi:transposase